MTESLPGRVLVTGARGFVGAVLVAALEARGVTVIAWASPRAGGVDVTDEAAVARGLAAARPDAIVHLAGVTHLPKVLADPEAALAVNVGGARNVLAAARAEAPGTRVLIVSSCSVYGAPRPEALPLTEESPLLAEHPYGLQKIAIERHATECRGLGQDVVIARPFNHIGVGQEPRFAASWFARQIAQAEAGLAAPELRVGNLEPKRDVLDVRDVVRAYLKLLAVKSREFVFNVARGESTRIGWILDWMVARAAVPLRVVPEPTLFRPMDAPDLRGSHARLHAATGWRPTIPIDDTLTEILDDARRRARGAG